MAWSPDATKVVSGSGRELKIWDVRTETLLRTLTGHPTEVRSVAWSPDAGKIASASVDRTIRVWDAQAGTPVRTFAHTSGVASVAWTRDSGKIASGSDDGTVQLWDTQTDILIRTLTAPRIFAVAWSPDGSMVAGASERTVIRIWDAHTGVLIKTLTGHTSLVSSVAWSPDSSKIVSGAEQPENNIKVWDVHTGALTRTLTGHRGSVNSVAWSPDSSRIASSSFDRTVKIWDAYTGTLLKTLTGHTDWVNSVAWSPDSSRIVSGARLGEMRIWNAQTGELIRTLAAHSSEVLSVAWSPDARKIASGSGDRTIKIWDVQTGDLIRTLTGHADDVKSVAWSSDSSKLASVSWDKTIRIWDGQSGALIRILSGHLDAEPPPLSFRISSLVAWSPDARKIASSFGGNTLKIWDAHADVVLRTLAGHTRQVRSISWSPDARKVASASCFSATVDALCVEGVEGEVKLWDARTGTALATLTGHKSGASSLSWSPDSSKIASGSVDRTVIIWNAGTGALLRTLTGHRAGVSSVAWSPDSSRIASGTCGRVVAGSGCAEGEIRVWDAHNGVLLRTLAGHTGWTRSVAWSPDASRIASGSCGSRGYSSCIEGEIRIWDANTGALLGTLTGHGREVLSVSWSPDGSKLASGAEDSTIKIWDAQTGALLRTLIPAGSSFVAWSPDGSKIASGSRRVVELWDARTGARVSTLAGHTEDVESVSWSPDGREIASAARDRTIRLWRFRQSLAHSYVLPHIASGQNAESTFKTAIVLANPSNNPATVSVTLTGSRDGTPPNKTAILSSSQVHVTLTGSRDETLQVSRRIGQELSTFRIELAPGNMRVLPIGSSSLRLTAGAAVVHANVPIGVSALFSTLSNERLVSEAGVLDSPAMDNFTIPVDNTGGARVGIALFNPHNSDATLQVSLLDAEGRSVAGTAWQLNAKSQEAQFVDELFSSSIPANFRGSLVVASTLPVSGVALRATGALLATLPVIPRSPHTPPYVLPQLANGQAGSLLVKTALVLTNPLDSPATAEITLTKDDGSPLVVAIPEHGIGSTFRIELMPRHTRILQTDGSGILTTGAALVRANAPVGVSALFSIFSEGQLVSEAGILDSSPLAGFAIPVDSTGGARVGVALFNPGDVTAHLTLRLLDAEGAFLGNIARTLNVQSHESLFVDELFLIPAGFRGTLTVSSLVPVSGMALRLTGSLLAAVPVIGGVSF